MMFRQSKQAYSSSKKNLSYQLAYKQQTKQQSQLTFQSSQSKQTKVIIKNLQDIIKSSSFSTKRNSIEQINNNNKYLMNKSYHLRPKKINTEINQSPNKINRSISKHSLKSKQKIQISMILGKEKEKQKNQHKNINKVSSINIKNNKKDKQIILDQVDAIFTQLQDFMRQAKQTIMNRIQSNVSQSYTQTIQKQLHSISQYIKLNLNKITNNNQDNQNYNILTPKQKQPLSHSTSTKRYISEQFTPSTPINSHQSNIQQYMRCQNTLQTTIYSQIQSQQYLPTQTDTQLLSMLAYKNKSIKINNSKRKLENYHTNNQLTHSYINNNNNQKLYQSQSKVLKQQNSFYKNKNQNSYFNTNNNNESNKKIKKNYQSIISYNSKELSKNQQQQQKQNRQRSIYQMVLMESQRKRISIHK